MKMEGTTKDRYPHMCRDGHPQIGHSTDYCPLCEALANELLNKPFEPCVIYYPDANYTEMVLRDVAVVNCQLAPGFSAGFDMDTGELVMLRVSGDVTKRK